MSERSCHQDESQYPAAARLARYSARVTAVAGLSAVLLVAAAAAAASVLPAAAGGWRAAAEVPRTPFLNKGGTAQVYSVSCAADSCLAAGSYLDGSGRLQAFVVTEAKGRWGKAIQAPGTAVLAEGGVAQIYSVSCAAAGSCAAGGTYRVGSHYQAFVVTEAKGRWGKAIEVPRTPFLNKDGDASIGSVSCATAGSCTADGYYTDRSDRSQGFVVTETKGRWGKAIQAPGTAALDKGRTASMGSVSCAAPGSCAAGGGYTDGSGHFQAFVVTEAKGRWGNAAEVPGTAVLNQGGNADIPSVSCAAAGSCAAGGYYTDGSGRYQAFVVTQAKGRWGKATEVPGLAALNQGGYAQIHSVSCVSATTCAAGGIYKDSSGHYQAFIVSR